MRRLAPALLLLASCTDAPLEPHATVLTPTGPVGRSFFSDVSWTRSTTGVDVIAVGQVNGAFTILVDINDNGVAVGWRNSMFDGERAIRWENGVFTELGTLGGGFSRAYQVNNAGTIVGESSDEFGSFKPVVWENGVIRALPPLDPTTFRFGSARSINERGDVVGNDAVSFQTHAALWPAEGGAVDLGLLPGTDIGWATGINNVNGVFGQSISFSDFSRRATTWTNGTMSEVQLPAGVRPSGGDIATGRMFNDAGEFLAEQFIPSPFARHAFVFRDGQLQQLPLLPDAAGALAIPYGLNQRGDVVGTTHGPSTWQAVMWTRDGTLIDLGFPSAITTSAADAHGVNDGGYVVGAATAEWSPGSFGTGAVIWRVNRDVTPPVIIWSDNPGEFTVDQAVAITCSASDEGSGVASHTCTNISGDAYTFGLGPHTFTATATDNAGNTASASTTFRVKVTYGSLAILTSRLFSDAGIVSGLVNMLEAAEGKAAVGDTPGHGSALKGYMSAVASHAGKTVSASNAAILVELAGAL
jgi:uncharacterized membrane protein